MNNIEMFSGLITALITPFKDKQLDFDSLEKLLNNQIKNEVSAIVICGSTGEGASLNFEEYNNLIEATLEITKKSLPIIVATSSSSTAVATSVGDLATNLKVDGFMCSVPSYVKPTQDGIYKHFEAIHNSTNLPIMLYSVPSRTLTDFADDTIIALSKLDRIIALKDASNDFARPLRLNAKIGKNFNLLSGNDETSLSYQAQGGVGCVSVASNIVPDKCKKLQDLIKKGDFISALEMQQELLPLYIALFAETNPILVKYAASHLGLCQNELETTTYSSN